MLLLFVCAPMRADEEVGASSPSKSIINDDAERIMELRLIDSYVMNNGLVIYPNASDWMLPLGEFSQSLDLAIKVSAQLGMADGFIIEEGRGFHLDVRACRVEYAKRKETYDCKDVVVYRDEIFVHRRLIERWLPVDLKIDSLHSQVLVTTRERLPVELRREREMIADRSKGFAAEFDPGYPRQKVPYRLFEGVSLDEQLSFGVQKSGGVGEASVQHSSQIGAEVLGLETLAFLNGNEKKLQNWRLSFARRSPEGELFGPMHLRDVQLFNLISPQIPLVTNGKDGRGFMISTFPLTQPTNFQNQNFEGNLPAGWEVNLFRNDVLIDRQVSATGGRYSFKAVPLLYGRNTFRLTFFGPQGQRRDEYQTFNIAPELMRPGQRDFRLAFSQINDGPQRFSFQYSANFSDYFTTNVGIVRDTDGNNSYALLGLTGVNSLFLFSTNCAFATNGGKACEWNEQMGLSDSLQLGAKYTRLFDFHSEILNVNPSDNQISQVAGNLMYIVPTTPALSVTMEIARNSYATGVDNTLLKNRLSLAADSVFVNNELTYSLDGQSPLTGKATVDYLPGIFAYRLGVDYASNQLSGFDLEGGTTGTKFSWMLGAKYVLQDHMLSYRGTLNRLFTNCTLGLSANYANTSNFSLSALISISAQPDPQAVDVHLTRDTTTNQGSASVLVFHDKNRNGIHDPDEKTFPKMKVAVNQSDANHVTDDHGVAFITGLRAYVPTDLSVSVRSLDDPFLRPGVPGVRIVPRPSKTAPVLLPLVTVGQTDGNVMLEIDKKARGKRGIIMEIFDARGAFVGKSKTDRDGFYQFENLAPGPYTIRVSPEQMASVGLAGEPASRTVTIPEEGSFETGQDFVVKLIK